MDALVFGALKNTEVGLVEISKDDAVNDINVIINKVERTFARTIIVKSLEKVGIYHRTNNQTEDRKSYFAIDTTKIDECNHKKLGNVLINFTETIQDENKYLPINSFKCLLI